jgi:hypothetical protein
MTISVYPATPVPSRSYQVGQSFQTQISNYDAGNETRRELLRFSKRAFANEYPGKVVASRDTIHDFYRDMRGSAIAFWYVAFNSAKWKDEYVGRGVLYTMTGAIAAVHPDSSDANRTDETTLANQATANDMTLMQAAPAQNDAYYFIQASFFPDVLAINIGTPGVGTWTITYEYWNGSTFAACTNVTDGTSAFKAAAGIHNVLVDKPSDAATTTIKGITGYCVRARVSAYSAITTQPKGTQAWCGSRYYDLHGKTTSSQAIYKNGTALTVTTDYSIISGGGEASADRVKLVAMPAVGDLITSDFIGFLRIKGRFKTDTFQEDIVGLSKSLYSFKTEIQEVQW